MNKLIPHLVIAATIGYFAAKLMYPLTYIGLAYPILVVFLSLKNKRILSVLDLPKAFTEVGETKPKKGKNQVNPADYQFSVKFENASGVHGLNWKDINRHFLNIGGSGAGKSFSWIVPFIYNSARLNRATLVYDYEFPSLSGFFEDAFQGKPRKYINFADINKSSRVNPIAPRYMDSVAAARDLAEVIILNLNVGEKDKGSFWVTSQISFLTGVLWYYRTEKPTECFLPNIIAAIQLTDPLLLIGKIAKNIEVEGVVSSLSTALKNNSANQVSGVLGSLQNNLSKLYTKELFYILGADEVDLNISNKENPYSLVLCSNPKLVDVYSPIISLIMSVAMKSMNEGGKQPSSVIIDEASTLIIPSLERVLATCRKNQMSVFMAVQDLSQLKVKYGNEETKQLLANFNNQIFGKVNELDTAEYCSRIFGKEYREYQTTSKSRNALNFKGASQTLMGDM